MKRKIIKGLSSFALATALAVSLASCGNTQDNQKPADKPTYQIQFEEKGGNQVTDVTFTEGGKVTELPTPVKDGFVFGGWYKDPELLNKFNLNDELPKESFVLYARWDVELKFDSKGGTAVDSITGKPLSPVTLPASPVRQGYVFKGWFLDEALTKPLTVIFPAKNATVYAKWGVAEDTTALTLNPFVVNEHDAAGILMEGNKFTLTKEKGEWAHIFTTIDHNVKAFGALELEVEGTKGLEIMVKLEGGDAAFVEQKFTLSGTKEKILMPVDEKNLSSVPGEKVLIFAKPGVAGDENTNETFTIHSTKVVRTLDEGATSTDSAVFFVTNGADPIAPIFGKIGSNLTLPNDPVKPFADFTGWYTDKELQNKFTGTTFPETSIVLYAGFKSQVKSMDLLNTEFIENDLGTYNFVKEANGSLTINKVKNFWAFAKTTLTGKDIKGMGYLKIEVTGKKGEKVLFKVNDNQDGEKWVEFNNGEKQYVYIDFTKVTIDDNKPALLIFVNPEAETPSSVNITKLEFTNVMDHTSLLADKEFNPLDAGSHNLVFDNEKKELAVEKVINNQYSFLASTLKAKDVANAKKLVVTVKGVAGEELLIKPFNQFDQRVTLTGELQTIIVDLPKANNLEDFALLFVINSSKEGASKGVVFTQIDLLS